MHSYPTVCPDYVYSEPGHNQLHNSHCCAEEDCHKRPSRSRTGKVSVVCRDFQFKIFENHANQGRASNYQGKTKYCLNNQDRQVMIVVELTKRKWMLRQNRDIIAMNSCRDDRFERYIAMRKKWIIHFYSTFYFQRNIVGDRAIVIQFTFTTFGHRRR